MVEIYGLKLAFFDLGWPAAAAVAYSCAVGAFISGSFGGVLHGRNDLELHGSKSRIINQLIVAPEYVNGIVLPVDGGWLAR